MKFITASSGKLVELGQLQRPNAGRQAVSTGLDGLDQLLGGAGLVRGAVHELLHPVDSAGPMFLAMLLARASCLPISDPSVLPASAIGGPSSFAPAFAKQLAEETQEEQGVIVISDPAGQLYPPAAAQLGIPLSRLYLLHPKNRADELWAICECLGSAGVSAVVASLGRLSQLEARRLQLAAERNGSMGIFIRPAGQVSNVYAAATRLLVIPQPADASCRCWNIQLVHGHGALAGQSVFLEYNRETHSLRAFTELADRKNAAATTLRFRAIA